MKWCMLIKLDPPLEVMIEAVDMADATDAAIALYPNTEIEMLYSDGPPGLHFHGSIAIITASEGRAFTPASVTAFKETLRGLQVYKRTWDPGHAPNSVSMDTTRPLSAAEHAELEKLVVGLETVPARDWKAAS